MSSYIFATYDSQCNVCDLNDRSYEIIDDETSSVWIYYTVEANSINGDTDIVFCKDFLFG
jgi:hypothetical protein